MNTRRALSFILHALSLVTSILIVLLTGPASSHAAPPSSSPEIWPTVNLPAGARSLSGPLTSPRQANLQLKLDSTLAGLAQAAQRSPQAAVELAKMHGLNTSAGRVHVQITTQAQDLEAAVAAITHAGGQVTGTAREGTLIQGWLPIGALERLADHPSIALIRRPVPLVLMETLQVGSATTEGAAAINAPAWHTAGYRGAGVKVGIIDAGFTGYSNLLGSDLPASVTVRNFVDGENDAQVNGTDKHGTACAEIIHDLAPGAALYLAKIQTDLDLAEAVAWLKDTCQVDIISTSLGWYNVTPGDGSGFFANLVHQARQAGILWVTAAGNDRVRHWDGAYSDPDGDSLHNFAAGQSVNYFGPGTGAAYLIPSGYLIQVCVRWDDWSAVNQDFDVHLVRWNGQTWQGIASSTDIQNGQYGQTPTEYVAAVSSGGDAPYGVVIENYQSTRAVNLEIFTPRIARLDKAVFSRSLCNLADAPDALTVAALNAAAPYAQESYSSEGPTNGPGGTLHGGLNKPDLSGFANVSTFSYGTDKFNGTSAATPHVAGAAALVLSAFPSYTPDQLETWLATHALDSGSPGLDPQFGYGRLYLGDPPAPTPTATATRTPTPRATQVPRPCYLPAVLKGASPTPTATATASATPTRTASATASASPSATATRTSTITATPTATSSLIATIPANKPLALDGALGLCIPRSTKILGSLGYNSFRQGLRPLPAAAPAPRGG